MDFSKRRLKIRKHRKGKLTMSIYMKTKKKITGKAAQHNINNSY